jgi:hypothetical protein
LLKQRLQPLLLLLWGFTLVPVSFLGVSFCTD